MNRKSYFSFLAFALTLAATVAFVVGYSTRTRAASTSAALSALPASDFVISVDVQRALGEMLPALLSSNPQLLAKINANLKEFEDKTGISPQVFESVAVGGSLNPAALHGGHGQSGIVILRGSFKSNELLNAAFAAAKKECDFEKEEQQYEGKTIYLIGPVRPLKDAGKETDPTINEHYSFRLGMSPSGADRFAIAAIDMNTIAIGTLESVRASVDASLGRNRVDEELVRLATLSPNAVVSFSGKFPQSATEKLGSAGESPAAKYFASIRAFYGSFAVNSSEAETNAAIRTETAEQANEISQAINTIKGFAGIGISQSAGKDIAAITDVLKSLTIRAEENEVHVDFKISISSLAPFIHAH